MAPALKSPPIRRIDRVGNRQRWSANGDRRSGPSEKHGAAAQGLDLLMPTLADAGRDLAAIRVALRRRKAKVAVSRIMSGCAFALAFWSRQLLLHSPASPVAAIVAPLSLGFALVDAPYIRRFAANAREIEKAIPSGPLL